MTLPAYEGGSGGNIYRRPFRSRARTPYDRPPSAARGLRSTSTVEGNGGGWLPKFLEPASRFITRIASRLFSAVFRSEEKCLVKLDTPAKVSVEQSMVDHNSIAQVMVGMSNLEQLLRQKMFTRAEVKHLMEVINSRSIESMKSKSENNDQAKGSFFQEDKTSHSFGSHGAKTLDPSIAPNFVESLSQVAMVPVVANLTTRPRGKAAIYRMARSPYFMIDPLTKMKRGREFRWNAGGGPSLSRGISRRNLKLLGNQALKRDASFLDDDDGLLGPICKIPKKSMKNDYNEEPKAKDESPGMHATIIPDVSSDKNYKNLKESQSGKRNKIMKNVPFTTISREVIANSDVNDAFIYRSDLPIIRSTNSIMPSHATLNLRTNSYFRISAFEYSSPLDEEDDTIDDSIDDTTDDSIDDTTDDSTDYSIPSLLDLSKLELNIPEQRNSVSELL